MVSGIWEGAAVLAVLCFQRVGVIEAGPSSACLLLLLCGVGYCCGKERKALGAWR